MSQHQIQIRPAAAADIEAMWTIFNAVIEAGESYPFAPGTSRAACADYWFNPRSTSFVAVAGDQRVLGMYKLVPNQMDLGAHVANASYMVSPAAQGAGVGTLLGRHSLAEARRQGYLAMQFNYVISSNLAAVALWKKLGFAIIGTLPKSFRHARLGYVDAYVMYQLLSDPADWPAPPLR
ncbi:GNAT family N-acetyltransferase [Massilia scottii]|uniref:GNAT family N-acetyltransferase n=1 Tax=Massilia scottii TaxID=3057166 RepID=UPI002796E296|nr:N-acetyltransferase [Massilia sp. CCM 9029]MDQ1829443.1 N-acetyltransferase [Massilia sp. CCM 9029]